MILTRQHFIYVVVGISCAVLDIGLMKLLISLNINYLYAATFGFSAGLILNFILHTRITFNAHYSHSAFVRYMVVVLANYFLTLLSIAIFQELFNMPVTGKIVSLPLVAINGFLLIKHWVHQQ